MSVWFYNASSYMQIGRLSLCLIYICWAPVSHITNYWHHTTISSKHCSIITLAHFQIWIWKCVPGSQKWAVETVRGCKRGTILSCHKCLLTWNACFDAFQLLLRCESEEMCHSGVWWCTGSEQNRMLLMSIKTFKSDPCLVSLVPPLSLPLVCRLHWPN